MGGARGIPLYAIEYPRFCKQTQIHIHCVWQWHDGKGVASSSDCCVASRVATNDQKADGMHALALLNRELLLCLCKSAALCRTKKKKKLFFLQQQRDRVAGSTLRTSSWYCMHSCL